MSPAVTTRGPTSLGNLQAGLALSLDSLVNLGLLISILLGFGLPASVVFGKMIPGSAAGVVVGNLLYGLLARHLQHNHPHRRITAIPLGLDTPSTLGLALGVLGPAFASERTRLIELGVATDQAILQAGEFSWQVGMGLLWAMGSAKVMLAPFGGFVRRHTPRAALLGALGGIGLMLLMFLPLVEVGRAPLVGLVSLGIVILVMVAELRLPFGLSGLPVAVILGAVLHHVGLRLGLPGVGIAENAHVPFGLALPIPTHQGLLALWHALPYLPMALPFAFLTVIGGINNTASAHAAGDPYRTRNVLWVSAISTLSTAALGGVAQPTPYIGHPAYKRMGATTSYGVITALLVGSVAFCGGTALLTAWVPLAALMPVMMFIGLEICGQAITQAPRRHLPAVLLAFLPTLANLLLIRFEALGAHVENTLMRHHVLADGEPGLGLMTLLREAEDAFDLGLWRMMGHGFILTAMLWGAWIACALDRRPKRAALWLVVCALATAFGAIHSPDAQGAFFLPWAAPCTAMWGWVLGYLVLAMLCAVVAMTPQVLPPIDEEKAS